MTATELDDKTSELHAALERIARRVAAQPHNQSGSDKTWVLRTMWSALRLREQIRSAKRVRVG
jgi:hypothetical protein